MKFGMLSWFGIKLLHDFMKRDAVPPKSDRILVAIKSCESTLYIINRITTIYDQEYRCQVAIKSLHDFIASPVFHQPLGKTDTAPIITAHLAGKTTAAGMLFERQGILFRHIDLAFDIWKGNEGHLISSSHTLNH
jgi:hypothetical protein